jgi:hypothetical protein
VSVAAADQGAKTDGPAHEGSPVATAGDVATPADLSPAEAAMPKKSFSEKVKETWRFWFGD